MWIAVLIAYRKRLTRLAVVAGLASAILVWLVPIAQPFVASPTLYGSGWDGRRHLGEGSQGGSASYGVGWPFESHRYSARFGNNRFPTQGPIDGVFDPHVTIAGGPLLIPTRPVWIGLALNWLLYSVTVVGLYAFVLYRRGKGRWRRGRCFFCGYTLEDLPSRERCPECGKPQVMHAQG